MAQSVTSKPEGTRRLADPDSAAHNEATKADTMDNELLQEAPPPYGGSHQPAPVAEYLRKLAQALRRGDATEHTHRSALQEFLEALDGQIVAINEPKRSQCGAPDYVVSRRRDQLSLGYIEAKDVGAGLGEIQCSDQLKRYLAALPNLLLTDYVEFR